MKPLICMNLDADAEEGSKVAGAYGIGALPTLLFLEPDGGVRDLIVGYMAPLPFRAEVARIRRNEGTFTGLRLRLKEDPDDLMARYELSKKLALIGDHEGAQTELDQIRERDPEAKSLASRWLEFDELVAALALAEAPDSGPFRELLKDVDDALLLKEGWSQIQLIHLYLAVEAEDADQRAAELERSIAAGRQALEHCPTEALATYATELANTYWEQREHSSAAARAFAQETAARATELAPEQAGIRDVYACCLFMNGRVKEAIQQTMRCIEQDPENPRWPARLEQFEAGG